MSKRRQVGKGDGRKGKQEEAELADLYQEFVQSFKPSDQKDKARGGFIQGKSIIPSSKPNVDQILKSKGQEMEQKALPQMFLPESYNPETFVSSIKKEEYSHKNQDLALHNKAYQYDTKQSTYQAPKYNSALANTPQPIKQQPIPQPIKQQVKNEFAMYDSDEEEREKQRRMEEEKKQRNPMDQLMQKLQSQQQRIGGSGGKGAFDSIDIQMMGGSYDDGDPNSTNLYVGNLAPDVNEEILKKEFGRYGAIASVKIMWPRTDEEFRRQRNCGFVAFIRRDEAQKAKDALNGEYLHDYDLHIGWGKHVPIPVGVFNPQQLMAQKMEQAPTLMPFQGVRGPSKAGVDLKHQGNGSDIEVQIPQDSHVRFIIDSVAFYVLKDGCQFEQVIMDKEASNPEFQFMFKLDSPEHIYYRWRLYSLANDDDLRSWRIEPFVMIEGGPRWVPPPQTIGEGNKLTAAQKSGGEQGALTGREKENLLSETERDRFEDILRNITVERNTISDAMCFAIDHADAAGDIIDTLSESLTLFETPLHIKLARLFLLSDILHNSSVSVKNASRFRNHIEQHAADVFESLHQLYRTTESRITQEGFKKQILRLLRVWKNWFIFSENFLVGLESTFMRTFNIPFFSYYDEMESLEQLGQYEGQIGKEEKYKQDEIIIQNMSFVDEDLARELQSSTVEEVQRKAKLSGLSSKGEKQAQIARLLALKAYKDGIDGQGKDVTARLFDLYDSEQENQEYQDDETPKQADIQGISQEDVLMENNNVSLKKPKTSAWEEVDEEEDQKNRVEGPVSKWLFEKQQEDLQKELDLKEQQQKEQQDQYQQYYDQNQMNTYYNNDYYQGLNQQYEDQSLFTNEDQRKEYSLPLQNIKGTQNELSSTPIQNQQEGHNKLQSLLQYNDDDNVSGNEDDQINIAINDTDSDKELDILDLKADQIIKNQAPSFQAKTEVDEETRQQLRKIEVEVMLLRDQLEEDGINKLEIDEQVDKLRQTLQQQQVLQNKLQLQQYQQSQQDSDKYISKDFNGHKRSIEHSDKKSSKLKLDKKERSKERDSSLHEKYSKQTSKNKRSKHKDKERQVSKERELGEVRTKDEYDKERKHKDDKGKSSRKDKKRNRTVSSSRSRSPKSHRKETRKR